MDPSHAPSRRRLGPYELGERLGSGGMAEVYIARRDGPHGFSKRCAVKLILPQLARDPHFVSMFCDEARICAALSHPNIVQVMDFGEHDGDLFMAMEYVDGVSCAKLLRAVASRGERVPLGAALYVVHEVLRGLGYAHSARDEKGRPFGIVHRDVSPGNIMVGRAGEVKLTDFGIVRSAFIDRRTNPGELKGKIGYMSPEQALGAELDARSDLFTVGIVLAEMLLARPLFPGKNELEILSRIHDADLGVLERHGASLRPDLLDILRTALEKDPKRRFASAEEFAEALRDVARSAGVGLSDTDLVPWLASLELFPNASGTRPAAGRVPKVELRAAPRRPLPRTVPSDRPTAPAGPRFSVRLGPGNIVGPWTVTEVVERIATGALAPRVLVSEDGARPRALVATESVGHLARREVFALGSLPRGGAFVAFDRLRFPALLFRIAGERATGLLIVRAGRREKRVWFRNGAPVFISSTFKEELLGQRLIATGVLSQSDLSRALEGAVRKRSSLGAELLAQELVPPEALVKALRDQLVLRLFEIATWKRGELAFAPGERPDAEAFAADGNPMRLPSELVRAAYTNRDIEACFAPLRDSPIAASPVPVALPLLSTLDADELRVIELSASARSVEVLTRELERALEIAPATTRRAVFLGLSAGLLAMPGWRS